MGTKMTLNNITNKTLPIDNIITRKNLLSKGVFGLLICDLHGQTTFYSEYEKGYFKEKQIILSGFITALSLYAEEWGGFLTDVGIGIGKISIKRFGEYIFCLFHSHKLHDGLTSESRSMVVELIFRNIYLNFKKHCSVTISENNHKSIVHIQNMDSILLNIVDLASNMVLNNL